MEVLRRIRPLLASEPNLVRIDGKVVVVGDIHGQYHDLLTMLRKCKGRSASSDNKILFLGDYVDRGEYGVEVAVYLFCLKLKYPHDIMLLRGNHESRDMAESFNFRDQVLIQYDEEIFDEFMDVFDQLPVAGLVNG